MFVVSCTLPFSYCLPSVLISQLPFSHLKEIMLLDPLPCSFVIPQHRSSREELRELKKENNANSQEAPASNVHRLLAQSRLYRQSSFRIHWVHVHLFSARLEEDLKKKKSFFFFFCGTLKIIIQNFKEENKLD